MKSPSTIHMETVTDADEIAAAQTRRAALERNADWLESHAAEVYSNRGKHVCIAGQQLFVGDTADQAIQQAVKAHPQDVGILLRYVPMERVPRNYAWADANRR